MNKPMPVSTSTTYKWINSGEVILSGDVKPLQNSGEVILSGDVYIELT
jgi:hypothetical protein